MLKNSWYLKGIEASEEQILKKIDTWKVLLRKYK